MVEICVSRNFNIDGLGRLRAANHGAVRTVIESAFPSIGDGAYTRQTTLPGKLMVDASVQWQNLSPLPANLLMRVQRPSRRWVVSNPNAVQIRDRWTYTLDGSTPTAPITTSLLQSQVGGAVDISTNTTATPLFGQLWEYVDTELTEEWIGPIEPGALFRFRYRCYLWTPPPWADNASNNSARHEAYVQGVFLRAMAFPVQDEAVSL